MNDYQPIIDVTPLEHSNERKAGNARGSRGSKTQQTSQSSFWNASSSRYSSNGSGATPPFGGSYTQNAESAAASKNGGSVIGGLAQIAAGAGLVIIGIPMLILPGPGLLSIAGGFLLAANGFRKVFG